jgi:tape measure domain-containing protein
VAYRADIEIGVKGTEKLRELRSTIASLSAQINKLDELANTFQAPIQSVLNYTKSVQLATTALNKAELGSQDEADAVKAAARALTEENTVRQRKIFLLDTEIRKQQGLLRAARTTGTFELGPGGPGFSGGFTAGQRQLANEQAILRTNEVQNKVRREKLQILSREEDFEIRLGRIRERNAAADAKRKRGGGRGKLAKDALSNAAVGGAFPLLFGQSGAAAAGGAIGGIAGSLIPGIGGFGGSLIGTIIGEKAGQGNQIKELAADIGFSAEQTTLLSTAFEQAGREFDKFQLSVQNIRGLSLAVNDQAKAIQIVSTLTQNYGGQIDKVTNAFTSALESGKVSQATLNQLTSQGIPIQQALADKYKVSRDTLLELAKDGKISVQDLIDTLVDLGNTGPAEITKNKTSVENLVDSVNNLGTALAGLGANLVSTFGPIFKYLTDRVTDFTNAISRAISRFRDLQFNAGKMTQITFKAEGNAQASTTKKYGPLARAYNPAAEKYFQQQRISELKKLSPGSFAPKEKPPALESFAAPSQAAPGGGGGAGSNKAANEAKRLAEQTKKQLDDAFKLNELASARLELQVSLSGEETLEAEFNKIALERRIKFVDLQKAALSDKERELLASAQLSNILSDNNQYEKDKQKLFAQQTAELYTQIGLSDVLGKKFQGNLAGGFMGTSGTGTFRTDLNLVPGLTGGKLGEEYANIEQQLKDLLDPANQVITAANAIGTAFGESFKGLISGTLTAREALAGFFESIASSFADMAAQILTEYIKLQIIGVISKFFPGPGPIGGTDFSGAFGGGGGLGSSQFVAGNSFGGFLASGGPAMAGTPYIVGEKGPELFMPGRSGTVIPNNALGGSTSVVVNVDASGNSNVQGDQQQGKQLGVAISAAVQAELVKQQRPGGLLAGTRR